MSKPFDSLTIIDNFMFGAVMRNPEKCKALLECVLDIKIRKIEYPELEKTIDNTYEAKSIRLDVYVEDEENTIYNIEMQATDKKNLPKRTRYYQGMIDLNIINKGQNYNKLKKSYVIFICDYDEFGYGLHRYTFEKRCNEIPDLVLGDDTVVVILNTKGTEDDVNDEVKNLLDYIGGGEPTSDLAKSLDKEVEKVKSNEDWRRDFMTLLMSYNEHEEIGSYRKVIEQVKKNHNILSTEQMSAFFDVEIEVVNTILDNLETEEEKLVELLINLEN